MSNEEMEVVEMFRKLNDRRKECLVWMLRRMLEAEEKGCPIEP